MSEPRGAAVRLPPPLVPLILLGVGMGVHRFVPLVTPLGQGAAGWILGLGFVVAGVALVTLAMGWFRKTGQDPKPWTESPELILEGIYRWTRNPMYVGFGALQAGIGLLLGSLWPLLLVPMTGWAIQRTAIVHEEAYLTATFGEPYERYMESVRRWL